MKLRALAIAAILCAFEAPISFARADCTISKVTELPVKMRGTRPTVMATVNGVEAPFLFDSGAFFSMLAPGSVARFGLTTQAAPPNLIVNGAGGRANVRVATARVLVLGGVTFHRADFLVNDKAGESDLAGLLGANMTVNADVEYDLADGVIRVFQPSPGCKNASLAYWAGDKPYSVISIDPTSITNTHLRGEASVNGTKIKVIFDTGAATSVLELSAAARAGVTPSTPGVTGGGVGAGIGLRSYMEDWIGSFSSFKIGDEDIRNTRLRFARMDFAVGDDMLLGADFFLSHRIYVSRSQHKLYFTYNGGPVFNLGVAPRVAATGPASGAAPGATPPPATADPYSNAPKTAEEFSRRAAALSGRREFAAAIDDLTKAIALEPTSADYVYQRAVAHLFARQPILAQIDLDQTLKLRPTDIPARLARARLDYDRKDLVGAKQALADADKLAVQQPVQRLALAGAYQSVGLWRDSIVELDQWIATYPKEDRLAQALNARCWARARLGAELDKALADCDAALRILPGDPAFLDSRGLVYLRRGEFDRGAADYQAILKLEPNNAWALYGRGWARVKKGDALVGQADIKAAMALAPKLAEEAAARGLSL